MCTKFDECSFSSSFEISTFNHFKDTKDNAKRRNWVGLGLVGVTQGHRQDSLTIR